MASQVVIGRDYCRSPCRHTDGRAGAVVVVTDAAGADAPPAGGTGSSLDVVVIVSPYS